MPRILLTIFALAMALPSARAVVVALSDDPAYTQAPPVNDFGFASVGTVHNTIAGIPASGVYIGDSWVLSAYHNVSNGGSGFAFGPVVFGGIVFSVDPATATRLHNPDNSLADLAMFRLTSEPAVLSASLSGTTPATGAPVRMMGNGEDRDLTETHWVVVGNSWTEVPSGGNRSGYELVGTRAMRWGTNNVESSTLVTVGSSQFGNVRAFGLDFDRVSGEGVATGGDSGGGVFVMNGAAWNLAGIMTATMPLPGQPASTVVYDNITYAANIATYKAEIELTMATIPEPASLALLLCGLAVLPRRRLPRED